MMPKIAKNHESRKPISLDEFGEFISINDLCAVEDDSRATITRRLRRGDYVAVKDGHKTKVLVASVKARRAALPAATFRPTH